MTVRTFNGGFVQMGTALSITNGVTAEVRALILEREGRDKARRQSYRKSRTIRPGSKGDTFRTYIPTH
jgi:hypothetical protein